MQMARMTNGMGVKGQFCCNGYPSFVLDILCYGKMTGCTREGLRSINSSQFRT